MNIDELIQALIIIRANQPSAEFDFHGDIIYVGNFDPDTLHPANYKFLDETGWFEDEGSWAHFV